MAQAEEILEDDDYETEEADELERLLEGTQNEEADVEGSDEQTAEKGGRFSFSKKTWFIVGGGTFLILLLAGGAYYFLSPSSQSLKVEVQSKEQAKPQEGEEQGGEDLSTPPPVETVKSPFKKVNIFTLESFFLPLQLNGKDTGKFISVIPNLVLSNNTLNKEIEHSLPAIRRNIYNVLSRKNPREYYSGKGKIEEKIKKEILTTVNPILLAGTGSVTDVVFTQFVVK